VSQLVLSATNAWEGAKKPIWLKNKKTTNLIVFIDVKKISPSRAFFDFFALNCVSFIHKGYI